MCLTTRLALTPPKLPFVSTLHLFLLGQSVQRRIPPSAQAPPKRPRATPLPDQVLDNLLETVLQFLAAPCDRSAASLVAVRNILAASLARAAPITCSRPRAPARGDATTTAVRRCGLGRAAEEGFGGRYSPARAPPGRR
ncbi:hypothetical protein ACQ4PT_033226 [Festuca glaucescens]